MPLQAQVEYLLRQEAYVSFVGQAQANLPAPFAVLRDKFRDGLPVPIFKDFVICQFHGVLNIRD